MTTMKKFIITKEMTISDCVENYPETVEVLHRHGLACFGCAISRLENLAQGAALHGIDIDVLIEELNASITDDEQKALVKDVDE